MRSLILTLLYLTKDTIHRWMSNLSSPIARVLVVFFMTLCALFFLGSYVISTKLVRQQIERQGADSVSMVIAQANGITFPTEAEITQRLGVESIALRAIGYSSDKDLRNVIIFTYDFNRSRQIYPLLSHGQATLLTSTHSVPQGMRSLKIAGHKQTVIVRHLPKEHPIMRMSHGSCLIVPPDLLKQLGSQLNYQSLYIKLRLGGQEVNVAKLSEIAKYLSSYAQLENQPATIISAIDLLQNMDVLLGNQGQTRAAFCLGIAGIVGILLTALASMEFRQNEYVYTLLKSFGIHPLILILCFIGENLFLVTLSFLAAVYSFMQAQKILLTQFSQHGGISLQLAEILPEIKLIAISLIVCVLFSSIPIAIAANKQIGRVLK